MVDMLSDIDKQLYMNVKGSNISKVRYLMGYTNVRDIFVLNGQNMLMIAAHYSEPEMIILLLNNGIDINAEDFNGETALIKAIKANKLDNIITLINKGANINIKTKNNETILDIKRMYVTNPEITKILERLFDVPAIFEIEEILPSDTPLIIASKNSNINEVKKLIRSGVDINQTNSNGETALMNAPTNIIAFILLKSGANRDHIKLIKRLDVRNYARYIVNTDRTETEWQKICNDEKSLQNYALYDYAAKWGIKSNNPDNITKKNEVCNELYNLMEHELKKPLIKFKDLYPNKKCLYKSLNDGDIDYEDLPIEDILVIDKYGNIDFILKRKDYYFDEKKGIVDTPQVTIDIDGINIPLLSIDMDGRIECFTYNDIKNMFHKNKNGLYINPHTRQVLPNQKFINEFITKREMYKQLVGEPKPRPVVTVKSDIDKIKEIADKHNIEYEKLLQFSNDQLIELFNYFKIIIPPHFKIKIPDTPLTNSQEFKMILSTSKNKGILIILDSIKNSQNINELKLKINQAKIFTKEEEHKRKEIADAVENISMYIDAKDIYDLSLNQLLRLYNENYVSIPSNINNLLDLQLYLVKNLSPQYYREFYIGLTEIRQEIDIRRILTDIYNSVKTIYKNVDDFIARVFKVARDQKLDYLAVKLGNKYPVRNVIRGQQPGEVATQQPGFVGGVRIDSWIQMLNDILCNLPKDKYSLFVEYLSQIPK